MTTPNMVMHRVLQVTILLPVLFTELTVDGGVVNNFVDTEEQFYKDEVNDVVRRWAPLVLLAPGEQFMPSSVPYFLQNMMPANQYNKHVIQEQQDLPSGTASEYYHLFTKHPVEQLLLNSSSFLFGQNPHHESVPVYTVITRCHTNKYPSWFTNTLNDTPQKSTFHVTYWFFYPFNEGKNVCTLSLGFLGPVPIPKMFNKCLGEQQYVGNHVGDWEHMSLYFKNSDIPESMYVSTHDAGVYYRLDKETNVFKYERQETRNGILQAPKFPTKVYLLHGHPLLYSAKGSHGLWSKPGKHRYTTVPRFYDDTGNGTPWKTWDNLEIIDPPYNNVPKWMKYRGRWGNSKSYCHPLKKLGIDICQLSDGPTGIPMKRLNFKCPKKL